MWAFISVYKLAFGFMCGNSSKNANRRATGTEYRSRFFFAIFVNIHRELLLLRKQCCCWCFGFTKRAVFSTFFRPQHSLQPCRNEMIYTRFCSALCGSKLKCAWACSRRIRPRIRQEYYLHVKDIARNKQIWTACWRFLLSICLRLRLVVVGVFVVCFRTLFVACNCVQEDNNKQK